MTRLYEEVSTRLEEMAMITARALQLEARADYAVKFNPLSEQMDRDLAAVEIVSTPRSRGCFDYRQGACFEAEK